MNTAHQTKVKSRFAPTPSGLLHRGNGYNFLLTYLLTKIQGGSIHLRIDDYDLMRSRPEYIQDIFETMSWLDLSWDTGPKSALDFEQNFSSLFRHELYKFNLKKLSNVFVCECSRKDLKNVTSYPGVCYKKNLPFIAGQNSIRIRGTETMDDFVIWTKEDLPSYQLASLSDDLELGINLIIRGEDLKKSTEFQIFLSTILESNEFKKVQFIHHQLVLDQTNNKLSKSNHSDNLKSLRENGLSKYDFYKQFCEFMSLDLKGDINLENMMKSVETLKW
jgi:glutamyl/glutaminyl-tRNA synthetase